MPSGWQRLELEWVSVSSEEVKSAFVLALHNVSKVRVEILLTSDHIKVDY